MPRLSFYTQRWIISITRTAVIVVSTVQCLKLSFVYITTMKLTVIAPLQPIRRHGDQVDQRAVMVRGGLTALIISQSISIIKLISQTNKNQTAEIGLVMYIKLETAELQEQA